MQNAECRMQNAECRKIIRLVFHSAFCILHSAFCIGCTWDQLNPFKPPIPPPPPVESFVLRNGTLVADTVPKGKGVEAELAGAREFFRREDYDKAEKLYHHITNNEKNAASIVQEAVYYRAECLRLQGDLPKASDVYASLLEKFPINPYRDLAIQHLYDISRFWLQETWDEVRETQEKREGKRWMVWPRFVSLDKRKPLIDREGRAIERLKNVYTYEGKGGALADKALYLCGHVNYYNEDYHDADYHFTQLHELHPDSPYAPSALELAIKAKLMSTGGELYDGRKVAEARKMVDEALRLPSSQMSDERKRDLVGLLKSISKQQAEKDFQMADFYRRTGHPGSAYFMFEVVRRRYPDSHPESAASRSLKRMLEIRAKMAKEQQDRLGPPPEAEGRPIEQLLQPRKVINQPEPIGAPRPLPGVPETAPMPQKVPGATENAPPPRQLPPGLGGG
jgi:outer membrane protein assembly factor BamD (BamD/ComL family)